MSKRSPNYSPGTSYKTIIPELSPSNSYYANQPHKGLSPSLNSGPEYRSIPNEYFDDIYDQCFTGQLSILNSKKLFGYNDQPQIHLETAAFLAYLGGNFEMIKLFQNSPDPAFMEILQRFPRNTSKLHQNMLAVHQMLKYARDHNIEKIIEEIELLPIGERYNAGGIAGFICPSNWHTDPTEPDLGCCDHMYNCYEVLDKKDTYEFK